MRQQRVGRAEKVQKRFEQLSQENKEVLRAELIGKIQALQDRHKQLEDKLKAKERNRSEKVLIDQQRYREVVQREPLYKKMQKQYEQETEEALQLERESRLRELKTVKQIG